MNSYRFALGLDASDMGQAWPDLARPRGLFNAQWFVGSDAACMVTLWEEPTGELWFALTDDDRDARPEVRS